MIVNALRRAFASAQVAYAIVIIVIAVLYRFNPRMAEGLAFGVGFSSLVLGGLTLLRRD